MFCYHLPINRLIILNKSLQKKEGTAPLVSKVQTVSVDPTVHLNVQVLNLIEPLILVSEL